MLSSSADPLNSTSTHRLHKSSFVYLQLSKLYTKCYKTHFFQNGKFPCLLKSLLTLSFTFPGLEVCSILFSFNSSSEFLDWKGLNSWISETICCTSGTNVGACWVTISSSSKRDGTNSPDIKDSKKYLKLEIIQQYVHLPGRLSCEAVINRLIKILRLHCWKINFCCWMIWGTLQMIGINSFCSFSSMEGRSSLISDKIEKIMSSFSDLRRASSWKLALSFSLNQMH